MAHNDGTIRYKRSICNIRSYDNRNVNKNILSIKGRAGKHLTRNSQGFAGFSWSGFIFILLFLWSGIGASINNYKYIGCELQDEQILERHTLGVWFYDHYLGGYHFANLMQLYFLWYPVLVLSHALRHSGCVRGQ